MLLSRVGPGRDMNLEEKKEAFKTILDRECYGNWHAKQCPRRSDYLAHIRTPCWICDKNVALAEELASVMRRFRDETKEG